MLDSSTVDMLVEKFNLNATVREDLKDAKLFTIKNNANGNQHMLSIKGTRNDGTKFGHLVMWTRKGA